MCSPSLHPVYEFELVRSSRKCVECACVGIGVTMVTGVLALNKLSELVLLIGKRVDERGFGDGGTSSFKEKLICCKSIEEVMACFWSDEEANFTPPLWGGGGGGRGGGEFRGRWWFISIT